MYLEPLLNHCKAILKAPMKRWNGYQQRQLKVIPLILFPKPSKDLVDLRILVNKAVMQSIKSAPNDRLISGAHDFGLAARDAACFAFRQHVSELYYEIDGAWSKITKLYLSGRWPIAHSKDKLIMI
jgi:hypothetical protein